MGSDHAYRNVWDTSALNLDAVTDRFGSGEVQRYLEELHKGSQMPRRPRCPEHLAYDDRNGKYTGQAMALGLIACILSITVAIFGLVVLFGDAVIHDHPNMTAWLTFYSIDLKVLVAGILLSIVLAVPYLTIHSAGDARWKERDEELFADVANQIEAARIGGVTSSEANAWLLLSDPERRAFASDLRRLGSLRRELAQHRTELNERELKIAEQKISQRSEAFLEETRVAFLAAKENRTKTQAPDPDQKLRVLPPELTELITSEDATKAEPGFYLNYPKADGVNIAPQKHVSNSLKSTDDS